MTGVHSTMKINTPQQIEKLLNLKGKQWHRD